MQDTLTILKSSFPPSKRRVQLPSVDEDDQEEFSYIDLDDDFITNYAELIYSIFNHNCKDLNELRYLAALLFPLYLQPLKDGRGMHQEILFFIYKILNVLLQQNRRNEPSC